MRWSLVLASMMVFGASFAFERPPVGTDADERREVSLMRSVPGACLSLPLGDFALLISSERLNSLIRAKPKSWSSEPERLAVIAANRAQTLLSMPRRPADALGCQAVAEPIAEDVKYLLVSEIENGAVALVNSQSGALQEHVHLHYLAFRCGPHCGRGEILVRTPDGAVLLSVNWWVS